MNRHTCIKTFFHMYLSFNLAVTETVHIRSKCNLLYAYLSYHQQVNTATRSLEPDKGIQADSKLFDRWQLRRTDSNVPIIFGIRRTATAAENARPARAAQKGRTCRRTSVFPSNQT